MKNKISLVFTAGCVGGLFNSLTAWILGAAGLTAALGVKIAPALSPGWLYPRLIWGGLWGFLFLLPVFAHRPYFKGAMLGLAPAAVQLFVVFPLKADKGMMGLDLGLLTPAVVLLLNLVWGLTAAAWLRRK